MAAGTGQKIGLGVGVGLGLAGLAVLLAPAPKGAALDPATAKVEARLERAQAQAKGVLAARNGIDQASAEVIGLGLVRLDISGGDAATVVSRCSTLGKLTDGNTISELEHAVCAAVASAHKRGAPPAKVQTLASDIIAANAADGGTP